ncbi:hypothetical protein ACQKGL_14710 [Ensifer adhaerens]|uniref:hypothetical protein n=1 Tax=Ensifer adhaerens TaxID=106592 RepID=UPI003D026395
MLAPLPDNRREAGPVVEALGQDGFTHFPSIFALPIIAKMEMLAARQQKAFRSVRRRKLGNDG